MGLTSEVSNDGQVVLIRVSGDFTFGLYREFRRAYEKAAADAHFTIDLADTQYMDNAALGMLLVLREHVEAAGGRAEIVNCRPSIAKLLRVAHLDRYFRILSAA